VQPAVGDSTLPGGVGLGDPQRALPTPTILSFCKLLIPTQNQIINKVISSAKSLGNGLHPRPPFLLFFFSPFLQHKQPVAFILRTAMFSLAHVPEKPQHSPVKANRANTSSGGHRNKTRGA